MKTKIYFICPNNKFVSGGVKQIYRQVEILNKYGFEAFVILNKKSKLKWFETKAPVLYNSYIFKALKYSNQNKNSFIEKIKLWFLKKFSHKLESTAILVFPEIYGDKINKIAPKNKKIIFNQNCYYTFNQYSTENNYYTTPYQDPNTLGTIVVSEDSFAYLNYTFPSLHIYKTSIGINHSIFNYSNKKQKQICFMPRKLAEDVAQVVLILKLRNKLNNWKFISIDNKTEAEVAKIMKESIFFLSFNHREGFGLPPVEAMACGCYVIGYHGEAGKEYLFPSFSSIIESGDILTFVQKIEEMINIYEKDPTIILEKGKQASDFVLSKYSMEREEKDILNNWNNILNLY